MEIVINIVSTVILFLQTIVGFFKKDTNINCLNLQKTIKSINNKRIKSYSPALYMFDNMAISFTGREEEMKLLQEFACDEKELLWWAITGEAGKGKTRLAYEFLRSLNPKQWIARFIGVQDINEIVKFKGKFEPINRNLFLVLDYLYMHETEIATFIEMLSNIRLNKAKVRILLIEREYKKIDKKGEHIIAPWVPFFEHGFSTAKLKKALSYKPENLSLNHSNLSPESARSIVADYFNGKQSSLCQHEIDYIVDLSQKIRKQGTSPLILLILSENYMKHRRQINDNFSTNSLLSEITSDSFSDIKKCIKELDLSQEKTLREFLLISIIFPYLPLKKYLILANIFQNNVGTYDKFIKLVAKTPLCYEDSMSHELFLCTLKPDLIGEQFVFSYISSMDRSHVKHLFNKFNNFNKSDLSVFLMRFCNDYESDLSSVDLLDYFKSLIPDEESMIFTVRTDEGKEIQCETLFTFESDATKKNYIVYTDNTVDEEDNTRVYASVYDSGKEQTQLLPITTEKEWKIIQTILDELQKGHDIETVQKVIDDLDKPDD